MWAINESSNGREIIWEPDDQYHELVKAKNLDTCKNNCLAINNLAKYDNSSYDIEQNNLLEIFLHHTAIEYHYIKSNILIILNDIFKDWEFTQILLSQIVSALLVISFSIFVLLHFNLNICIIASIIILPYVTIIWGFHFSNNSSHLSCLFGIISLIFLYKLKYKYYLASLFFLGISIFTHPVGIFMMIFNFTFIFIKNKFKFKKNSIKYFFLSLNCCFTVLP